MKEIYLGNTIVKSKIKKVEGIFVEIENEKFYKISNYNQMTDFFMTIVSDSDHWMYISSNGSLTAGRKNRNNTLFPYYTDDKIHDYENKTGSKTFCLVKKNEKLFWWEPFTSESEKVYEVERNIYKSIYGNKLIFEEINFDLDLAFSYGWYNSEKYGWIKKSYLTSLSETTTPIQIIDGLQNILPHGIDYLFQNEYSNLADAYKKNECLPESNLGLFMLSSIPADRAEPSEALKTTTVWAKHSLYNAKILLSTKQIQNFKTGKTINTETDIRAARGAYFIAGETSLKKKEKIQRMYAAEINQDSADVANLHKWLLAAKNIEQFVNEDIQTGTANLKRIVAGADGLQLGNEELGCARHFSNTLFNVMRGGVFTENYSLRSADFIRYIQQTNKIIYQQFYTILEQLPQTLIYSDLIKWAKKHNNSDLERIALEYLPLTFSRRHGDPSRPWNIFSIETKNPDGTNKLNYEGNWRDIFQNWEALSLSFPEYIDGMICKFLNASTADGYNPYRITRGGIDWEIPNPDEPWSFIGYWGDHQIIYLQKFFEISNQFFPGKIDELLTREIFVYANVPYRIKEFEQIKSNPKDTIDFDYELNKKLLANASRLGADGKLLVQSDGKIAKANLAEKILTTLLSKLSNFIPEAGIWPNTQRSEWKDANNALVGNGFSMVTLYYLRRFISFWKKKLKTTPVEKVEISAELKKFFDKIYTLLSTNSYILNKGFSDEERYQLTAALGHAGGEFRNSMYKNSFSGEKTQLEISSLSGFLHVSLQFIDQTIEKNRRNDGLFHAYNIISIKNKSISIRHLYEMLEGQVAVLSSGYLLPHESLEVLDSLKASKLFRNDQYSYILYPDRDLPRFVEKNNIPESVVQKSELLKKLKAHKNESIIRVDESGTSHFNGAFRNAGDLANAFKQLDKNKYGLLVEKEKESILHTFETMFDHQSFTGRSGTFFGYEGLGSIYWHMVSKLLLATQENFLKALNQKSGEHIAGRLKDHYYEIKAGIGLYKSPELYGAFPTDAYSHTPANAGVKQPGLTGQVKEDVITRFGELGIQVENGILSFSPELLNPGEVLKSPAIFNYFNQNGDPESIKIETGKLAFTFCQVPIVYSFKKSGTINIHLKTGQVITINGNQLTAEHSLSLFQRKNEIAQINVFLELKQ